MPAEIIKGLPVANAMREEIIAQVKKLTATKGIQPKLAVVLVGDDEASRVYAQSKEKVGDKMGIKVELHVRPASTPEADVIKLIDELNADRNVHGILVELPLPKEIRRENVMARIDPKKDVDGVHPVNRGYLLNGQEEMALVPATPMACIELIERSGVELKGKRVTMVGWGDTVGRPLTCLLLIRWATLTVCHIETVDTASHCRSAEIIVAAAGCAKLVKSNWLSEGQTVIDVGINQLPDGSLCGDVDFEPASQIVRAITPVPGGVGSLTTTVIMKNLLKAISLQSL